MKTQQTPQLTPLQQAAVDRKLLEAEIIARAWEDDAFRTKLEADPIAALTEAGFPRPEAATFKVIAETPGTVTLILPARPVEGEVVNDADLAVVAGGLQGLHLDRPIRRRDRKLWGRNMPCTWH